MTEPTVPQFSPQALRATSEVVRVGLDRFFIKYPSEGSSGFVVPLGNEHVPAQSAAAAVGLDPLNLTTDASRRRAELKLLGHGLQMVSYAVYFPPQIGEDHPNRTAVRNRYGGDLVSGIVRFPGDTTVNCFSDETGAYADDPPTRDAAFGYRGDGLKGNQKLTSPGNKRLEEARSEGRPVRFWYKPRGGVFTFEMWCMVIGRHWSWGQGSDKQGRQEVVWTLRAIDDPRVPLPEGFADDVAPDSADDMDQVVGPEAQARPSYSELVRRLEGRPRARHIRNRIRRDPARSLAARRSVLIRADDKCESPWCEGMAADLARTGGALLEVDHVQDLARDGEDHPKNMVAICPNCHAAKTRGNQTELRRRQLAEAAFEKHAMAMSLDPHAEP
jgi:5-methylcytosine-specific restriction protein A